MSSLSANCPAGLMTAKTAFEHRQLARNRRNAMELTAAVFDSRVGNSGQVI